MWEKESKTRQKHGRGLTQAGWPFGVYLVTLSENPGNLLEIVPSYMLIQKSYYARCPEIVGMAKGKDEAIDLAVDIVKNIYGETGAFQVKEYFKNR